MWSLEFAKGQTTLEEDHYNTFKAHLTRTISVSLLPVSLSHTHICSLLVMEIFQTCNSRAPLLGNDKHTNTFSPESSLKEAEFSKPTYTSMSF